MICAMARSFASPVRVRGCSGDFFTEEDMQRLAGTGDLGRYAVDPTKAILPDLFLD